jgi:regulator of replication initiation timing
MIINQQLRQELLHISTRH